LAPRPPRGLVSQMRRHQPRIAFLRQARARPDNRNHITWVWACQDQFQVVTVHSLGKAVRQHNRWARTPGCATTDSGSSVLSQTLNSHFRWPQGSARRPQLALRAARTPKLALVRPATWLIPQWPRRSKHRRVAGSSAKGAPGPAANANNGLGRDGSRPRGSTLLCDRPGTRRGGRARCRPARSKPPDCPFEATMLRP